MNLSLVILQHNLPYLTATAMDSIRNNTLLPDEVIIVDNGSDKCNRMSEDNAISILLPTNVGYVAGTNYGWRVAKGDYIVLCNNDISLSYNCLRRMINVMETDKTIGWLSATYQAGPWDNCRRDFPADVVQELEGWRGAKRGLLNKWSTSLEPRIHYCDVTEGTVVMVRKRVSDMIGYYDDMLTYHHTHDYGMRVRAAGFKTAVCRDAVFWHYVNHPTLQLVGLKEGDEKREKAWVASTTRMNARWGKAWQNMSH